MADDIKPFTRLQYLYLMMRLKGKQPGFISHKEIFVFVMD